MNEIQGYVLSGQSTPELPIKPRCVTIEKVLNGYIVKVGCQAVVFELQNKMLAEIARYLDNPEKVEKEYLKP